MNIARTPKSIESDPLLSHKLVIPAEAGIHVFDCAV